MTIDLKSHIRSVPDFPKQGIVFYDICSLLAHGPAWQEATARMVELVKKEKPDVLIAIEARGFVVASVVAAQLGIGLVLIRKKGKLPGAVESYTYDLEYGSDTMEIQKGVLRQGQRAVIIDDVIATGGTVLAATALTRKMGAEVICAAFLIELSFLGARNRLDVPVLSLLTYDD